MAALLQRTTDTITRNQAELLSSWKSDLQNLGGYHNVKPEELDTVNGFGFVRLSVTVGVAASQTSAQVLGLNPRFAPADASNQAAVVQVI